MGGVVPATVDYTYDGRGNRVERTSWVSETWTGDSPGGGSVDRVLVDNLADQVRVHKGLNYQVGLGNAEEWTYDPLTGELATAKVGVGERSVASCRPLRLLQQRVGVVGLLR